MDLVWEFEALGAPWRIRSDQPMTEPLRALVESRIEGFDATWSRFRADSLVSALRSGLPVDLGPDAPAILDLYDRLVEVTGGAVNPLVGASLESLGYDAQYSLRGGKPVAAPDWGELQRDGSTVTVPVGTVLDIGAAGKGFVAERVADDLASAGVASIVNASGDIVNRSGADLRIALEHPADSELAIGTAVVADGESICGSAANRRAWGDGLHHVLDARTGEPTRGVVAAWAVGRRAAVCDGVATAAFFAEVESLAWSNTAVLAVDVNGRPHFLRWPGEVFT